MMTYVCADCGWLVHRADLGPDDVVPPRCMTCQFIEDEIPDAEIRAEVRRILHK